jgi:hypothetical protein
MTSFGKMNVQLAVDVVSEQVEQVMLHDTTNEIGSLGKA